MTLDGPSQTCAVRLACSLAALVAGCVADSAGPPPPSPSSSVTAPGSVIDGEVDVDRLDEGGADGTPDTNAECSTACDCDPGVDCAGGFCAAGTERVFCCTATPCPLDELCEYPNGALDLCPGPVERECVSACDCPALLACISGACTPTAEIIQCCSDPFCVPGTTCQDVQGSFDTCPELQPPEPPLPP